MGRLDLHTRNMSKSTHLRVR